MAQEALVSKVVQEFKEFILRGNVVELAVAVIIGAAFTGIVTAVNDGLVSPLVGMLGGRDFTEYDFVLNDSTFNYGIVINAAISFLMVAAIVFFLIVKPMNILMARMKRDVQDEPAAPETPADVALLTEIRDLLKAQRTP
jgi:large conductance mechanosensitive channel